jgi:ankyrin repeat protein
VLFQFTPISRSIYECSPEITDIFLVGMADANSKLSDGRSILSHAAEAGNLELVTQILDQGGHADEPESEDKDLIQSIVEWCIARLARKPDSQPLTKLRATRLLAKFGKECNECDFGNKSTPLIRASQCRRETRLQIMSLLLSKGANPSSTDVWGETPLHRAVQTGHEDATHLLLRQDNAYVDAQNSRQATPLLEAAVRGHIQLVKILVQHGADVLHTISGGMTSLMLAAAVGELEVVSYLMEQGVPINASNDWGNTALLVAAGCGRTEVLAFLLQNGAAVDVKNKKGRCPVLAAAAEGYEECVDLLLSYGAKPARTNGFICVKAVVINMLCLDWRCVKLLLRRSHRVPNP